MTAQTWIEIPETLLSEACRQLDPNPLDKRFWNRTTSINRGLVEALIAYFEEGYDGCDHSVNICQCAIVDVMNELRLALDGEQTCRACGGDGMLWSKERYKEGMTDFMDKNNCDRGWAMEVLGETPGDGDCPACNKTGKTRL